MPRARPPRGSTAHPRRRRARPGRRGARAANACDAPRRSPPRRRQPAEKERARARLRVHGPIVWCGRWRRLTNDKAELSPRTEFEGPVARVRFPGPRDRRRRVRRGPDRLHGLPFPAGRGVARSTSAAARPASAARATSSVHAICLAGGSLYGLEAAAGVAAELLARRGVPDRLDGHPDRRGRDHLRLGTRATTLSIPTRSSGGPRSARRARGHLPARPARRRPLGHASGRSSTTQEGEPAGQGAAFRQVGETKVAVFTVVNAIGAIFDRDGTVVRGHYDRGSGERPWPRPARRGPARAGPLDPAAAGQHDADRRRDQSQARLAPAAARSAARCTRPWRARSSRSTRSRTGTSSSPSRPPRLRRSSARHDGARDRRVGTSLGRRFDVLLD